jgi:hypothetical protein
MSAFQVSDNHIWMIVRAYAELTGEDIDQQDIADRMLCENIRSVNFRYREETEIPEHCEQNWPEGFEAARAKYNFADLTRMVQCYEYQSCEHEEWDRSAARQFSQIALHEFENAARLRHESIRDSEVWDI